MLCPGRFLYLGNSLAVLRAAVYHLGNIRYRDPIIVYGRRRHFVITRRLHRLGGLARGVVLRPTKHGATPTVTLTTLTTGHRDPRDSPLVLMLTTSRIVTSRSTFHTTIHGTVPCTRTNGLIAFNVIPSLPRAKCNCVHHNRISTNRRSAITFRITRFIRGPGLRATRTCMTDNRCC